VIHPVTRKATTNNEPFGQDYGKSYLEKTIKGYQALMPDIGTLAATA
jgi:hypothetical protein